MDDRKDSTNTLSCAELIQGIESLQRRWEQASSDNRKLTLRQSELEAFSNRLQARNQDLVRSENALKGRVTRVEADLLTSKTALESEKNLRRNEVQKLLSQISDLQSTQAKQREQIESSLLGHSETKTELNTLRLQLGAALERSKKLSAELAQAETLRAEKNQEINKLRERGFLESRVKNKFFKLFQESERSRKELTKELELALCRIQWAQEELQKSARSQRNLELNKQALAEAVSKSENEKKTLRTEMSAREEALRLESQILAMHAAQFGKKQEQERMKSSLGALAIAIDPASREMGPLIAGAVSCSDDQKTLDPAEARPMQIVHGDRFIETPAKIQEVKS